MKRKKISRRTFIHSAGSAVAAAGLFLPFSWASGFGALMKGRFAGSDPQFTDLFVSGEEGYPRYRIPSLVVTKSGMIVACCQARQEGGDNAQNDIVIKRSTDGGRTWGPMQVIADDGKRALDGHCLLVDREIGRIIMVTGSLPNGCHADCIEPGYVGDKVMRVYQVQSDDDGKTWSEMKDITRIVRRPDPFVGGRCGNGVGLQLRRKPYAGRLILPTNNRYKNGGNEVCSIYSDDHGKTWKRGAFASREQVDSGPSETKMVELADGTVMLNTRAELHRKIAYSYDGGETWTPLQNEPQLVDSGCNASIVRYSDPLDGEKSRLLFSNPATQSKREKGTIRLSYDEGKTWPVKKMFYKGDFGYSSMARLPNGDIGILFERDKVKRGVWQAMTFSRFSIEWLTI